MPSFDPTLLLLVGVAVLFYFMLIRPQQKRAKEQQQKMSSLAEGDRVMTISGIVGTIRYLGEKQVILEISPGVEMTVVKAAVSSQPVEDEFEYAADGSVEQVAEPEPETEAADAEPVDTPDGGEADSAATEGTEPTK
ncbi:MAG: preprotein translocase subunit YajC [Propionibacteriales bacterium]|nr:preprotein translocase subunit YajC [Propionibacteriales bacterium]